jgi:hypothetical protein
MHTRARSRRHMWLKFDTVMFHVRSRTKGYDMKPIQLPYGKIAMVSDCDLQLVQRLNWSDRGNGYVRARFRRDAGGNGKFVYLHRFIMGSPSGYVVDHLDGNPLNNTRENLQIVTQSRNVMRTASGGVTKHRDKWRARTRIDGKKPQSGMLLRRE